MKINILYDNGRYYSSIPEIANKLVDTYSAVSSTGNYDQQFQEIKQFQEQLPIDVVSPNHEIYKKLFSISELEQALQHTKDTSPGKDTVTYQMLKRMNEHSKQYLLYIYN